MKEKYMIEAIKQAKKAYKKDEVPIGAIIVKNNKIISKGYNKKEKKHIVTNHAEIIAIEKANKKLKTWHLDECELYTTLEPCMMCSGAIIQSRIKKVYCSIKNNNNDLNKIIKENKLKIDIEYGICKKESLSLIQSFFNKKRK